MPPTPFLELRSRRGPPHVGRPGGPGGGAGDGLMCLDWGGKKRENAKRGPEIAQASLA